jgi:RHS repeat-associated protein
MFAPTGGLGSAVYGKISGGFAGLTEIRTYNNRLQLTGISASSSAGTALNITHSYTSASHTADNGEIVSIVNNADTGRTQNLTHDDLGRISAASSQATSGADCWGQSFTIDAVANITNIAITQCSANALSAAVNSNNQLTTGYTYDAAGNMTNDDSYAYNYNAENEITSAGGVTYTYDGNRMRVKKSSGTLYWRGLDGSTIAETNLSGTTTNEYVFFGGRRAVQRDSTGNNYYHQADQLGTTRSVTKVTSSGSASVCYDADFTPFGSEMTHTSSCTPNYKFTGYERDSETGLDYALDRYYNSRIGRFMNPDPVGLASVDFNSPQSLNRYAYVLNNPLAMIDPSGDDATYPCSDPINAPTQCNIPPYFDASFMGVPSSAPIGMVNVGLQNGFGEFGNPPGIYVAGHEMATLPSWYLAEAYPIRCADSQCSNVPPVLLALVKVLQTAQGKVYYLNIGGTTLPPLPANVPVPSWVGQVAGKCTRAANAIQAYVNQNPQSSVPGGLLLALQACSQPPQ